MVKDDAVRNQKVFITLGSVLQLQTELLSAKDDMRTEAQGASADYSRGYFRALSSVVETLGLPIQIPR